LKHKVILTQRYQEEAIQQLQEVYDLVIVEGSGKTTAAILAQHPDAEALISFLSDKVDRSLIDLGQNLKVIANYAVGYNNIDVAHALTKGILVTHTPDVLTDATADFTMALLLAVARHVVAGDTLTRAGKFTGWGANLLLGKELRGCSLGIIGLGRIGLATALRAKSFGMNILYYSRSRKNQLENQYDLTYLPFDQLVKTADVISLHIPATTETHHLFNKEVLDLMKKDAIFLNVARGDLVDESYLAEKLAHNPLFSAGLDVYEQEPRVTETLKTLTNVVLAPHLGSATYKARMAMAQLTINNVNAALTGMTPPNLVKECINAKHQKL